MTEQIKRVAIRQRTPEEEARLRAQLDLVIGERRRRAAMRPQIEAEGIEALRRLLPVAQGDTGQSRIVSRFLLGCYNGTRFPFDLTDLRGLDYALHDDCMAVLRMDFQPAQEVHCYFTDGSRIFEKLAKEWALT